MNNLDKNETRLGKIWFLVAFPVAVCLSFALATLDLKLTHSDSEIIKGQEIGELRLAQTSLPSNNTDPRNLVKVTNQNVAHKEDHSSHEDDMHDVEAHDDHSGHDEHAHDDHGHSH